MPFQQPVRLLETFQNEPIERHAAGWESLWKDSFTPWDRGTYSPPLDDILADRKDLFEPPQGQAGRKKALVPGCGRGYDVLLLAALGYDTYGLDYSESAIKVAKEVQEQVGNEEAYQARTGVEKGAITWLTGDFFKNDFLAQAGVDKFDLIFDYTFFCALPPSARPTWAKRMAELLRTDGRLICLEFPSSKPPSTQGPPFGVAPDVYAAHLAHPGEDIPYDGDGKVITDITSHPSGTALERVVHLTPTRTHQAGYDDDGNVDDRISVWKRYIARPAGVRHGR